jgi:hypothetical protein
VDPKSVESTTGPTMPQVEEELSVRDREDILKMQVMQKMEEADKLAKPIPDPFNPE